MAQGQRAADIDVVIGQRFADRLADRLERCEVDHSIAPRFAQNASQMLTVAYIAFDNTRDTPGDLCDPIDDLATVNDMPSCASPGDVG